MSDMTDNTEKMCRLLSIDAWKDAGAGWDWNAWYNIGQVPASLCDLPTRQLLAALREWGLVIPPGTCTTQDDDYNIVVVDRRTREPLWAIEYGPLYS